MVNEKEISLHEKILDASRSLLLEEGYRNFSLRKTARMAGVSATSIYLYFKNKDHLIHSLIDESIQHLNERLEKTASEVKDPLSRLEALARTYVDFGLNNPREYQIIYFVSSDEMARYPKNKFRRARKGYDILTRTIEEGVRKKIMREENPRMATYIFWAQLHGVMSVVLTKRLDIRIDQNEFINQAIEHIIHVFYIRTDALR